MEGLVATSPSWAITVVRVVLGVVFFAHGAQKVLGWFGGYGLRGTTGYLQSLGLPLVVAYLVCFFEFFGGIGLVLGFLTRLAFLAMAVACMLAGGGALAVDAWLAR
jgi:putative oxidoreductase